MFSSGRLDPWWNAAPGFQLYARWLWHTSKRFKKLRPKRKGHHFADDFFVFILLNENWRILIQIPMKFVPRDPINNKPSLAQIIRCCLDNALSGAKPLSELMTV